MSLSPRTPNPMPGPGGQSCETCAMFLITDYPTGYCREESPTGETARIKVGKERPWPLCYAGDWCGRYITVADYLAEGSTGAPAVVEFTPLVTFGGSSAGIVLAPESIGRYQQVGGFVDCWVQVVVADKGTQASGEIHVAGLPPGSVKPFTPLTGVSMPGAWVPSVEVDKVRMIVEDNGNLTFAIIAATPTLLTSTELLAGAGLVIAGTYPWVPPPQ